VPTANAELYIDFEEEEKEKKSLFFSSLQKKFFSSLKKKFFFTTKKKFSSCPFGSSVSCCSQLGKKNVSKQRCSALLDKSDTAYCVHQFNAVFHSGIRPGGLGPRAKRWAP
jgi:hypothetical protein